MSGFIALNHRRALLKPVHEEPPACHQRDRRIAARVESPKRPLAHARGSVGSLRYRFIALPIHRIADSLALPIHCVTDSSRYRFIALPIHRITDSLHCRFIALPIHRIADSLALPIHLRWRFICVGDFSRY
jgi:hypothetical protein